MLTLSLWVTLCVLQGTFGIPLLVSAHRDPTQCKDPDHFNPTNFLADHSEFQNNDAFMPFAQVWARREGT